MLYIYVSEKTTVSIEVKMVAIKITTNSNKKACLMICAEDKE